MKVLLAVDGSDNTRRAIAYVTSHEWLRAGNDLLVFTVVLAVPHRAAAMAGPDLTRRYYEDDAQGVLRPVREAFAAAGIAASFGWEVAHPGEAIARKASQQACDLVVMGSHGHSSLANLVLGSVATQVLARCDVPVLLVR